MQLAEVNYSWNNIFLSVSFSVKPVTATSVKPVTATSSK